MLLQLDRFRADTDIANTVYVNDSTAMIVYRYDFDVETGSLANKHIFIDRRDSYGEPDGMVVE